MAQSEGDDHGYLTSLRSHLFGDHVYAPRGGAPMREVSETD
jgi:hypothetical protein